VGKLLAMSKREMTNWGMRWQRQNGLNESESQRPKTLADISGLLPQNKPTA